MTGLTKTPLTLTCARCQRPVYPRTVRPSPDGWVCADTTECARIEDLTWLADCGASLAEAARRVGTSREALDRWLRRRGENALLWRLIAAEPARVVA